ncbi:hypothetical protein CK203_107741 [Vitis vinifera]|uniref:C2H2-type domain-containing protein n=1 Tax=Vitis vinifera TaxID=29760 RepID=A0A438C696_VITVI|nr:hypothetical protein CK203_107741 [Vitis vinifera]
MGGGEEGDDVKSKRVIVEARAVCNISCKGLGGSRVWRGQTRAHLYDQRNGGGDSNKINVTWNLQNGSEGGVAENGGTEARTCKKVFPTYQALSGNRSSHSYNKKSLDMENKYVSSSHTSASKGEGLALGTSKQVPQKAHKCRTCNKTFPRGQALGGTRQCTGRSQPNLLPPNMKH